MLYTVLIVLLCSIWAAVLILVIYIIFLLWETTGNGSGRKRKSEQEEDAMELGHNKKCPQCRRHTFEVIADAFRPLRYFRCLECGYAGAYDTKQKMIVDIDN